MKRAVFFVLFLSTLAVSGHCADGAKMEIPGRTPTYINDYARILDSPTRRYLEKLILCIDQKTADPVELIIATFDSIDGWNMEEFFSIYAENWRRIKGNRRDNGVIILYAVKEKRLAIGVGQNLKHILTQEVLNGVEKISISPAFNKGEYAHGIKDASEQIVKILNDSEIPHDDLSILFKIALLLAILLIILAFVTHRRISVKKSK